MSALSPELQQIAELYKKVKRWDAYMISITDNVMQQANIPQQDLENAKCAKAQLESMMEEQG
eukprot:14255479-Ditylum_brightwellii.AAC.2